MTTPLAADQPRTNRAGRKGKAARPMAFGYHHDRPTPNTPQMASPVDRPEVGFRGPSPNQAGTSTPHDRDRKARRPIRPGQPLVGLRSYRWSVGQSWNHRLGSPFL